MILDRLEKVKPAIEQIKQSHCSINDWQVFQAYPLEVNDKEKTLKLRVLASADYEVIMDLSLFHGAPIVTRETPGHTIIYLVFSENDDSVFYTIVINHQLTNKEIETYRSEADEMFSFFNKFNG